MGTSAAVVGDKITASCSAHQVPNPASGAPQPGPPFPFSAAITTQCEPKVLIGGKPALTLGSTCMCAYGGMITVVNPGGARETMA